MSELIQNKITSVVLSAVKQMNDSNFIKKIGHYSFIISENACTNFEEKILLDEFVEFFSHIDFESNKYLFDSKSKIEICFQTKFIYCPKCMRESLSHSGVCECEYKEIELFLDLYDKFTHRKYEHCGCPDKIGSNTFTCDLQYEDNKNNELYIEVKEIKYAFEMFGSQKKDTNIAIENGQTICAMIFDEIYIENVTLHQKIKGYKPIIFKQHLSISKKDDFKQVLLKFFTNTIFNLAEHRFLYKEKEYIVLKRKDTFDDTFKLHFEEYNDCKLMPITNSTDFNCKSYGISIEKMLSGFNDSNKLLELMKHNIKNTNKAQKFPVDNAVGNRKKVLLNILKVHSNFENIFEQSIGNCANDLINTNDSIFNQKYQIYLLFLCYDLNSYKPKLYCLPLNNYCKINNPTLY